MAVTVVSSTRSTRAVTVEPMASCPCSTVQTTLTPASVVPVVCLALKSYVDRNTPLLVRALFTAMTGRISSTGLPEPSSTA